MEKHAIFQDMSPMERIRLLESNATEMVDGFTYQRNLDDDDLSEEREKYCDIQLELLRLEEVKKAENDRMNAEIKVKKLLAGRCLGMIRTKREEVTETVYVIPNFDSNTICTYNSEGILVAERPMRASERQMTIGSMLHAKAS